MIESRSTADEWRSPPTILIDRHLGVRRQALNTKSFWERVARVAVFNTLRGTEKRHQTQCENRTVRPLKTPIRLKRWPIAADSRHPWRVNQFIFSILPTTLQDVRRYFSSDF